MSDYHLHFDLCDDENAAINEGLHVVWEKIMGGVTLKDVIDPTHGKPPLQIQAPVIQIMKAKPICQLCREPVDRVEWWDDNDMHRRYYDAHCHGETDRGCITHRRLMTLQGATDEKIAQYMTPFAGAANQGG